MSDAYSKTVDLNMTMSATMYMDDMHQTLRRNLHSSEKGRFCVFVVIRGIKAVYYGVLEGDIDRTRNKVAWACVNSRVIGRNKEISRDPHTS